MGIGQEPDTSSLVASTYRSDMLLLLVMRNGSNV